MTDLVTYDAASTVRGARALYFETNRFGADGGYGEKWVPVKVGPAEFMIRNTAARVRSVRLHDLHHIATGYPTTLEGEALIGAWELGSHCRDHFAAWFLNANAFAFGIVLAPRELWRAFVRGRRSKNLFGAEFHEGLLDITVGDLRGQLGVEGLHEATVTDRFVFAFWIAAGLYLLVWNLLSLPLLLLATLAYKLRRRSKSA
jgi:hypothetical protein